MNVKTIKTFIQILCGKTYIVHVHLLVLLHDVFFFWMITRRLKFYVPTFRSSFGWYSGVWNVMCRRFVLLLGDSPTSEFFIPTFHSSFRWFSGVWNVMCRRFVLLLGDSPTSEFYVPTFRSSFGRFPDVWILYTDVSFFFLVNPRRLKCYLPTFRNNLSITSSKALLAGSLNIPFKDGHGTALYFARCVCDSPPPPTCPCSFPDRVIPHPSFGQQTPHKLWKILHNGHGAIVRETRIFNDTLLTGWNYAK